MPELVTIQVAATRNNTTATVTDSQVSELDSDLEERAFHDKIEPESSASSELRDTDLEEDDDDDDEEPPDAAMQGCCIDSISVDPVTPADSTEAIPAHVEEEEGMVEKAPVEDVIIPGESITFLEHISSFSKPPATSTEQSTIREALILGAGSFRSVTLIQSLVKVFDKVYCIGPLSIKKKLRGIPNVELIEGNVWERKFGEESQNASQGGAGGGSRMTDDSSRSLRASSTIMSSFFKPSSPVRSPFTALGGDNSLSSSAKWDYLCQRVSHIYVSYGCFGIVSQKEFMSMNLRPHIERKVHAVAMNALEMAATGRTKRIVLYTHLNSQLAVCPPTGLVSEAQYATIKQLIACEKAINSELWPYGGSGGGGGGGGGGGDGGSSHLATPPSAASTEYGMNASAKYCAQNHKRLTSGLGRSNMFYILAWIDLILEAALMHARDILGYDVIILRMPSDLIGSGDIVVVRKHVCWTFIDVMTALGLFPEDLLTEVIFSNGTVHALDEVMRDSVAFSIDSDSYPIYQFVRKSELISVNECLESFRRVGMMHLRRCTQFEFSQALKSATDLSPLHMRAALDLIDYLSYPSRVIRQFSTTLYDHDRRRVLQNSPSRPGSGARLQNLYSKVLPRFSVKRALDTCLLALIKRGHMMMPELPSFNDLVEYSGYRSSLHKSCVCGKLKGCDCSRLNLLDTMENGWSRIFQESRQKWVDSHHDVESYAKHLALCRLASLSINTLHAMCSLEASSLNEQRRGSGVSGGGGGGGNGLSPSDEDHLDITNPIDLQAPHTSRQMFIFGTGVDLLLGLIDIDKKLTLEKSSSSTSTTSTTSTTTTSKQLPSHLPLHVVQNFEILNMYGFSLPVRPYKASTLTEHHRSDPRSSELNTFKSLCQIAGLDSVTSTTATTSLPLSPTPSLSQLCPLILLGRSAQLAVDFDLPLTLRFYKDEINENIEIMNSICSFQNRIHSHISCQYKNISCWIYSYDIQYSAVQPLMENILKDPISLRPTCVIIHRPVIDMIRYNYSEILMDFLRINLSIWIDYEDHMAIQFARDHPNLQPPRHFAIPILYDDLQNKPHITINHFLTKLIQPVGGGVGSGGGGGNSGGVVNEIYERYLSSRGMMNDDSGRRGQVAQKTILPLNIERQVNNQFAFYHIRWQNNIQKSQTESIIWQRMNHNCLEIKDYYDQQGRIIN